VCVCVCFPQFPPLVFVHISDISICAPVCEPNCVCTSDYALCVDMNVCVRQSVMCVIGYEASGVVV